MSKLNNLNMFIVLFTLVASGSILSKNCTSPSWQLPENCKSQEGNWIAENDKPCTNAKRWLGDKPSPEHVCCVECTSDGLEEAGMD